MLLGMKFLSEVIMKSIVKSLLIVVPMMLTALCLYAQTPYSSVFYSAEDAEGNRKLIFNADNQDQMLVHDGNAVVPIESQDYFGTGWRSATIPQGSHSHIGFRNEPQNNLLNPIYWPEISTYSLGKLSFMASDPAGDHIYSNVNLDIREVYAGFSANKVHFAIRNAGNGFPSGTDYTYFTYMVMLGHPAPGGYQPYYGLVHTINNYGIGAGLYKITSSDITGYSRIGNIETQIDHANNLLYLSCDWSLLLADADFMSWYDAEYPLASCSAVTSMKTVTSNFETMDYTPWVNLLYLKQQVPAANLYAPILGEPVYQDVAGIANVYIEYLDEDANLPLVHKVLIDGVEYGDLLPSLPINFGQSQGFYLDNIVLPVGCNTMELVFSDDGINYFSQYINNCSSVQDAIAPPSALSAYPNPFSGAITIKANRFAMQNSPLNVYNLKGQLVRSISLNKAEETVWDGKDSRGREVAPGLYFVMPQHGAGSPTAPLKVLKLK